MDGKLTNDDRIAALRVIARTALEGYRGATAGYECGAALAQYINPFAAIQARTFDKAMEKLRELDPLCPPCERLLP